MKADLLSRPTSKAGRLQRALLDLYREHEADGMLPTGGRFLWYELESRGIVDKTKARGHPGVKRGIDQDVSDALTHLRVVGLIPWADITDGTRNISDRTCVEDVEDGDETERWTIPIDPWEGAPPIVLVESRQAAGVLEDTADEYRCLISGLGGQVHGHVMVNIIPRLVEGQTILYLGDRDLSGDQIEANVTRIVNEHSPVPVQVERVGLTQEQVDDLGLEPIRKKDRRYTDGRPHWAVELEAMGQRRIIELLHDELEARLPAPMAEAVINERVIREVIEIRDTRRG